MLLLKIPKTEYYDEERNEFVVKDEQVLKLEHSLISISKWESKYCKPFLSKTPKTIEETLYYIECMNMNPRSDPSVYLCITNDMIEKINAYIEAPMTATQFNNLPNNRGGKEKLTSEYIYYLMIEAGVPIELEKWHLNRLITLLNIIGVKRDPHAKKMTKGQVMRQNASLNAARRQAMHSRG